MVMTLNDLLYMHKAIMEDEKKSEPRNDGTKHLKLNKEQKQQIMNDLLNGMHANEAAEKYGLKNPSVRYYKRKLKQMQVNDA